MKDHFFLFNLYGTVERCKVVYVFNRYAIIFQFSFIEFVTCLQTSRKLASDFNSFYTFFENNFMQEYCDTEDWADVDVLVDNIGVNEENGWVLWGERSKLMLQVSIRMIIEKSMDYNH